MRLFIPNSSKQAIGGGWTFLRNFKKAVGSQVQFVNSVDECDILMICGCTIVDKNIVHKARLMGKKIVFRVDNVPRKSRNRRSTPHERMKEYAELCDVVVYQSKWAEMYCKPLCGEGTIIYNGVDLDIFHPGQEPPEKDIYLYAYHGNNELKSFWQAHYFYQMVHRENPNAEFWFTYDFKRDLDELRKAHFDFWNGEKHTYMQKIQKPEEMANVMRMCKYLIYPSFADASPNIVLEARACGLEILHTVPHGGTQELLDIKDISIDRMGQEYLSLFKLLTTG